MIIITNCPSQTPELKHSEILNGQKMSKKKKLKEKDINKEYPKPQDRNAEVEKDEEKPFDFGGLPSRDLKKNLGCG